MTIFQSFRSTVSGWVRDRPAGDYHVLADPTTGAPVGLQTRNSSGPHGIWAPVDLTAAQIASPTAEMIADLNATYRLNVAPYTRYQSDGTTLVAVSAAGNATLSASQTFTGNNVFTGTTTVGATTAGAVTATSVAVSGALTANGTLVVATATPASAAAAGVAGTIAWDAGFIYVCTATNTWTRVAIATW